MQFSHYYRIDNEDQGLRILRIKIIICYFEKQTQIFLQTLFAQNQRSGKEGGFGNVRLNIGAFNNVALAIQTSEQGASKTGTSISHRQSGGTSTSLGLNNFSTSFLDTYSQFFNGRLITLEGRLALRQYGQNGNTGMTTNYGNIDFLGINTQSFTDESTSTYNIQCGNTEKTLGIIDTSLEINNLTI
ncbi:hypothetical protein FF38_13572 [Lucilia cuprina]|uniref:Uncharacterized protein n=1 Tax=Lucilia cuprina TaxID=7375 RepID=A0A0L0BXA2_LUCCU|nr:hypothetical protein FF38_13572 [Lucilia cuprina]